VRNTKTNKQVKKDTPGLTAGLRKDRILKKKKKKKKSSVLQNVYTQFTEQTSPMGSTEWE